MSTIASHSSRRNPPTQTLPANQSSQVIQHNLVQLGLLAHRSRKKSVHPKRSSKTVEFGSTTAHSN